MSIGKKIFLFLLLIGLVAGGCALEVASFNSLRKMRQMARLPHVAIKHALPGEVHIEGKVAKHNRLLKGPKSGVQCVHYRYTIEEERKDSEGKTSWHTIKDETNNVSFLLSDEDNKESTARLIPSGSMEFQINQSFHTREGKRRYTEWRLEPGHQATTFGYLTRNETEALVDYDQQGDYHPLLTNKDEKGIRQGKGLGSLLMSWGGLACLSFATLCLSGILGIHRLLVYLAILAVVQSGTLVYFGIRMMESDLVAAQSRVEHKLDAFKKILSSSQGNPDASWTGDLSSLGDFSSAPWSNLPEDDRTNLREMRNNIAITAASSQKGREQFPDNVIAWITGVDAIPDIPVPEADAEKVTAVKDAAGLPLFSGGSMTWGFIWMGIGGLIAFISGWIGVKQIKFKRCIENLPTSPVGGVAFGLSEIVGKAKDIRGFPALTGPLSYKKCVYYHYVVKEKRGSGKNSKWVTIQEDRMYQPFACEDESGVIKVAPFDAEILCNQTSSKREGRLRYSESRIEMDHEIYAIGHAKVDPATGEHLMIDKPDEKSFPFIISGFTEREVMLKKAFNGMFGLNIAFAGFVLAVLMMSGMLASFAPSDYLLAALCGPFSLAVIAVVLHFNDLIFLKKRAERNWSNIDVSLKKRVDLLPALESVVKEMMRYESDLMEKLTLARSGYSKDIAKDPDKTAEFLKNEESLTKSIIGLWEAYPDLKANTAAAKLTKTLIDLENEVSLMRKGYNDAVETYNSRIQSVPDVFLARLGRMEEKPFLSFAPEIHHVPEVVLEIVTPEATPQPPPLTSSSSAQTLEDAPFPASRETQATALPTPAIASNEEKAASKLALGSLLSSAKDGDDAAQTLMAMLVRDDDHGGTSHLDVIEKQLGFVAKDTVQKLLPEIWKIHDNEQPSILSNCLEKMASLESSRLQSYKRTITELSQKDEAISLFEYALNRGLSRLIENAEGEKSPVVYYSYAKLDPEVSTLLSFIGQLTGNEAEAKRRFEEAKKYMTEPGLDIEWLPYTDERLIEADAALEKLQGLDRSRRSKLVSTCEQMGAALDPPSHRQGLFLIAVKSTLGSE